MKNKKENLKSLLFGFSFLVVLYFSYLSGYNSIDINRVTSKLGGEASQVIKTDSTIDFMTNIEILSWNPRAQVYHNFLTQSECDKIVQYTEPKLIRSLVVDPNNSSNSILENTRTSSGAALEKNRDHEVASVINKATKQIEDWIRIPEANFELFYVLRYNEGQQYEQHTDFYKGPPGPAGNAFLGNAGDRIATVLVYLHTPDEGGETYFPKAKKGTNATAGTALLFWDYLPEGKADWNSLHAGTPVIKGVKWSMTRWIRMRPWD